MFAPLGGELRTIAGVTNVPIRPDHSPAAVADSFIGLIGLEIDDPVQIGQRSGRLAVVPGVCQPMGIVHGGIYAAIAETLASIGTADGIIDQNKVPLGMSNHTNFLRPISAGSVHADAHAIHRGRTTWLWDVEMRGDDHKLCATSRVTIAVREPLA
jgi:1,4-dihydroxy-2-naphthoyl-CoA hydrolase